MHTTKVIMDVDKKTLWREVLESLKVSVSSANFSTWLNQTHLFDLQKNGERYLVEVGCASSFVKSTIESRYFGLIQNSLAKSLEAPCDVAFSVKQDPTKKPEGTEALAPLFGEPKLSDIAVDTVSRFGLRPSFTFEDFAVSSSNQMAHAAAEAVSENLGTSYNPLFIWGGVGVGKTHLMQAVGHGVLRRDSQVSVLCTTGEQFTNDIVEGIRNKTTPSVRQKYRKLKALLVDDIQFIAGKDSVQEEFFHTFNALVLTGSQIILTSDRPPSEIAKLEERLRSRFEAGLIVDIAPPDFELRCAITQIKAAQKRMIIPMELVQAIAANLDSPRKIEGFLVKLSSEAMVKKIEPTLALVETLLGKGNQLNGSLQIKAKPDEVVSAVSKYFSLGKKQLLGASRARPVARPRQMLMYLLRTELNLPLEAVGVVVGNRDHTTVMHAVNRITQLAVSDVQIREDIFGIKKML